MKKKVFMLAVIAFVLLAGGIFYAVNAATSEVVKSTLGDGLKATGADILESTISGWSKINEEFMTPEQIAHEMDHIILMINPEKDSIARFEDSSDVVNKEILYASSGNKSYAIAIESIQNDEKAETYMIVDLYIDQSCDDLNNEREKLELIFKDKGRILKFDTCVIGTFDGKLSDRDMKEKIQKALKAVKAKPVEAAELEELNSVAAYSENLGAFILSGGKKVNMQVAMRYSSYDDKTYIWIGTPLIHIEY